MFRVIHPNRWFFWTIAVLVFSGISLVLLTQQGKQEFEQEAVQIVNPPEVPWLNFRSQSLGISLFYPSDWQIELEPESGNVVHIEHSQNFNENLTITVFSEKLEQVLRDSLKSKSEETIIIDGQPGRLLTGQDFSDPATENFILVKFAGKLYSIAGSAKEFRKIISTIKFLK